MANKDSCRLYHLPKMICSISTNTIHQNEFLMIEMHSCLILCVCFVYIYWHYFAFTFVHKFVVYFHLLNVILFIYLFIIYSKAFSVLKCLFNGNQQKTVDTQGFALHHDQVSYIKCSILRTSLSIYALHKYIWFFRIKLP